MGVVIGTIVIAGPDGADVGVETATADSLAPPAPVGADSAMDDCAGEADGDSAAGALVLNLKSTLVGAGPPPFVPDGPALKVTSDTV